MVTVSFPGIGIDHFSFSQTAFSIGNIEVRWYGIILVMGIMLAFTYATFRAKQYNIVFDDMLDFAIYGVIFGVIGARLYYVLNSLDKYKNFVDIFKIWEGGLAIYGAIIGGAAALIVTCRIKQIDWKVLLDCVAPGVMIAQVLGRWGNFFNGEAYGATPTEGSPLYFLRMGLQHEKWSQEYFFQPTFLYESVWNLIGFIIINLLYKKKKYNGQVLLWYVTWYGFGRMFIEGLREDSLYLGSFRVSQVLAAACFVIGVVIQIIVAIRLRQKSWWDDTETSPLEKATVTRRNIVNTEKQSTNTEETENSEENKDEEDENEETPEEEDDEEDEFEEEEENK